MLRSVGLVLVLTACGGAPAANPCGPGAQLDADQDRCFCEPGHHGDPDQECEPHGDLCGEAADRVGHPVCVHEMPDDATWNANSIAYWKRPDVRRISKYLVPALPSAPLPTLVSDANHYRVHYCMLKEAFAPQYPDIVFDDYSGLAFERATRTLYAGSVYELVGPDIPTRFGFIIETTHDEGEELSTEEIGGVYRALQDRFDAGDLAYIPATTRQIEHAATFTDTPFPVFVEAEGDVTFESYSAGLAYGRVRLFAAPDVDDASFGWQDIIVLETTSNVLQGVNAGVITGDRQDLLSHLNVLAAQRGTPNAFVADPLTVLAPFDGQLVRLEVTADTYAIAEADIAEAEAFWAGQRPTASIERPPDPDYTELPGLAEVPTQTDEERAQARSRIGGKATGLATLYRTLDPALAVDGFGIPVAFYLQFMEANRWSPDGGGELTYAETIDAWLADPAFRSDAAVRRERLEALATHIDDNSVVDEALLAALAERIPVVFGDPSVMVRFRSSSNAEDGVEFNGAGLYTSERACALDVGDETASACDADSKPRSLARALRKVWASLWSFGAFEEREYYQMDHARAAMGLLVSTRFKNEQANGVVFTGNPLDSEDTRLTVNVQRGEVDVVGSEPGIVAELDRLTIKDGAVAKIERSTRSSIPPHDVPVLSDAQLEALGAAVATVSSTYPDVGPGILLDLEFKVDASGAFKIKQIRPFRPNAEAGSLENCSLE